MSAAAAVVKARSTQTDRPDGLQTRQTHSHTHTHPRHKLYHVCEERNDNWGERIPTAIKRRVLTSSTITLIIAVLFSLVLRVVGL